MGLIKDIKDIQLNNPFNITKKDLTGAIKDLPLGVVVRMLEEQEKAGNDLDIEVFQCNKAAGGTKGFNWDKSEDGYNFWYYVIFERKYDEFYKKYPEYRKYDY